MGGTWTAFEQTLVAYMRDHGYWTLFWAMAVEGTGLPLPMEFLFIPAGFAVTRGEMSLWAIIAASTAGGLVGNLIGYWLGRWGGAAFVHRWGRYFRIEPGAIDRVSNWFYRHGGRTVLASRFLGFIRAPSILSAGIFRMDVARYLYYSAIGGVVWNGFWATVAWLFGSKIPELFGRVYRVIGPAAVVAAFGGFLWYAARRRHARPRPQAPGKPDPRGDPGV